MHYRLVKMFAFITTRGKETGAMTKCLKFFVKALSNYPLCTQVPKPVAGGFRYFIPTS